MISRMQKANRLELVPAPFLISFSKVSVAHAAPNAVSHELTARAASGVTAHGHKDDIVWGIRNRPKPEASAKSANKANPPRIHVGSGFFPLSCAPGKRLGMIQAIAKMG